MTASERGFDNASTEEEGAADDQDSHAIVSRSEGTASLGITLRAGAPTSRPNPRRLISTPVKNSAGGRGVGAPSLLSPDGLHNKTYSIGHLMHVQGA